MLDVGKTFFRIERGTQRVPFQMQNAKIKMPLGKAPFGWLPSAPLGTGRRQDRQDGQIEQRKTGNAGALKAKF